MLRRDYFNSLNFYRNGKLSRNQRSGVQVKIENEKFIVVCSRSPKNLEFGHFTLLFCRGQRRNLQKCKTHVQSDCFFLIKPIVLWRCRCRRRRRCLKAGFHMMIARSQIDLIAICDLRSAIIWRPAFMFYLLRSSAIMIAGSQTIAEVCFHMIADDRRRSQTLLRSAICDPRSYGNQP